jgi:hypothetical protein
MSKRIPELTLATQINPEDQFIFYSNSKGETQRISAENSANLTVPNTPAVLAATTNAALGIANAALADAKAAQALADAAIAQASAEGAQTSANGKAKVYYQSSAPTGGVYSTGDIWYDTDDNYKLYVRTGGAWVASFGPMLKLDANNNIFGLVKADGTDKSFVLVAENFQVWNGVSSEVPFEVVTDPSNPPNQVVRIKNAQIQTVDAGKITSGFISSQVVELANTNAYLQSSSFIETWTSGRAFRQKSLGKAAPSDQLQCKVEQLDGTFLVYDCLSSHTSSGASFPGVGGLWALTSTQPSAQSIGFRIVGNGQAEFNGVSVRGDVLALTGYFGNNKSVTKIGANGLTIGNQGYIKSDGITYAGTAFSGNGFFLGNTQGEGQENAYQFYIGNAATSKFLRWDGTNLIINGRIATGSTLGDSNSGSFVNDQGGIVVGSRIGIRRNVNDDILSITGGKDNWGSNVTLENGSAQIDLVGKNFPTGTASGNIAGVAQIIGGKTDTGNIFLRTWSGTDNLFNECLTASRNGSVGINDTAPSNSNGIKLDVYGSMRIREGVVYSTYNEYSGYTVALNDGTNNIRFQNNNVGLYAKVNNLDPVLIVSPKLNLSSQQILAPFSFATSQGTTGALVISDTNLTWDSNGTLSNGSGIVINPNGIVGALNGVAKFTITKSGNATFAGELSAPTGKFGGWTIGNTNISGGNITIDSSANNGYIATGQTAYNTGTGFWVGSVSGTAKLSVGNSAGNYLTWDGSSLSIKGSITLVNTIPSGSVSGLGTLATQNSISYGSLTGTKPPENADVTLSAIQGSLTLTGGGLVLASQGASIRGGQGAYNSGAGFFVGDVGGTTKFSLGNSAGNYLTWDGSTLTVNGNINVTGGNASTQTYAQGVASSAANSAQSAAASDATAKANSAQSTAIGVAASDATTKANAAQAVAISAAASDATTKANAAQATSIQAASLDATLKANTAYTNAKAIADGVAQGTYSNGTFISGQSIFSPVIAGVNGYFSNSFKVGNNGITLDGVNKSIYIGTGTYANANTGFYVDSNAYFSLKDKLYWNPATSTLTVQGNIVSSSIDSNSSVGGRNAGTIAGAIDSSGIITSAALNSKLDTAAGTILGQFALTGSGALQIGTYTYGSYGDIRITPNGITARNNLGATTFSIDGTTGNAVFAGQLSAASGTFAGALSAPSGTIGGFTIGASQLYTGSKSSLASNDAGVYVGTDGIALGANSPFKVTSAGVLTATSANITGAITATSGSFTGSITSTLGTIGGFNIDATRLYTSNISLDTSNKNLSISEGGTAILEVINSRARFAAKNNGGTYTAIIQGDDGVFSASFLSLNNSSGSEKIGFYAASGYGYFTTFYDKDDSNYYCDPASTSNFNGLNVGGNAVLTTGSGALTADTSITVTEIRKTGAGEGLTVPLVAGGNSISFRFADGKLIVKIDNTNFHIPLIAGTG